MSVIQDALRRKLIEQQQGKIAQPGRPAGNAVPPPTPPIAQQVLQQEAWVHPELHTPYPRAPYPKTSPVPHPQRSGVGRMILGTALVLIFAILVAGVLIYMNQGIPLTEVAHPTPPPTPTQRVVAEAPQSGEKEIAEWPEIKVNGVLASPNAEKSSAILNGEMVFLNQKIEGARLIEVRQEGVRLHFQGRELALATGSSTTDRED